jgi:hypothetical protein
MANQVMNIARGRIGYYMADALGLAGANSRHTIAVLEAAEADDTLNNYDALDTLIAAAGNTEAGSTNYARIETAAAGITVNIDDTANDAEAVVDADKTWTSVSQAAAESWVKLLCCYDSDNTGGGDASIVPMTHHDFSVTPNGGDITADFDQTNGFWRST